MKWVTKFRLFSQKFGAADFGPGVLLGPFLCPVTATHCHFLRLAASNAQSCDSTTVRLLFAFLADYECNGDLSTSIVLTSLTAIRCWNTRQQVWGAQNMVGDIGGDALIKLGELLLHQLGVGLGHLDLWWERRFGRSLSGRFYRSEIQTLFHGNTRDQDQI